MFASPGWTIDVPLVVGGTTAATVLLLALVERLRRTFATRQDLNGLGDRVSALQTLYVQVRENTDEIRERMAAMEGAQRHQWERVAEQVIRPLERITEKLEGLSEVQAAQAASLEHIGQRLDRTEAQQGISAPRPSQPPTPRKRT